MPEVKVNVRSPFPLKYQASNLVYVELEVYVYSGTKTVDKGDRKYYFKKYPIDGNDYVTFELAEIIRDYLVPDNNLLSNDVSDYVKWVQIEDSIVTEYIPDCTDISGFAVAQDGTITYPTSSSSDTIISLELMLTLIQDQKQHHQALAQIQAVVIFLGRLLHI